MSPLAIFRAPTLILPGVDLWYLEDEAEPRVHDAGPGWYSRSPSRNDVVLPTET
jgi:hypothetical protein